MIPARSMTCIVLLASSVTVGCSEANNPKMPDIPPSKIQADTSAHKSKGGSSPYGASQKYQDMMNR